jgi:cytochrome c
MRSLYALLLAPAFASLCLGQSPAPLQQGDPAAGKAAFTRCSSCHDVSANPSNRMGPYLTGVVGRPAASVEGFSYSSAMVSAKNGGLVWTPQSLTAFLKGPHEYVPGTKMPNIAIQDEMARANIVAYLLSLSPNFDPKTQSSSYSPASSALGSKNAASSPSP